MLIFQLTSFKPDEDLAAKVASLYPSAHQRLGTAHSWLLADEGVTTREVSDKLGLVPGASFSAIVVKVDSYFGLAPTSVWEWISVKAQS